MKTRILLLIVTICFFYISCETSKTKEKKVFSEIPNYEIKIKHFYGAEGVTIKYIIKKDTVQIFYNCDFEDCNDTLIFQDLIDSTSSKEYFNNLLTIPMNKLKKEYDDKRVKDGLFENIEIKNVYDRLINISKHFVHLIEVDKFYKITDSLILKNSKYKIKKNKNS